MKLNVQMCACRIMMSVVMNCSALPVHSIVVETIIIKYYALMLHTYIHVHIGPPSASVSISSGDVHRISQHCIYHSS